MKTSTAMELTLNSEDKMETTDEEYRKMTSGEDSARTWI